MMLRTLASLLLAFSLLFASPVSADVRPEEMVVKEAAAGLQFHYPARFAPAAQQLVDVGPTTVRQMADSLGLEDLGQVEVWVLPEVDDYFEVTGVKGRPPTWAIGLSLSDRGVIIVVNGTGPDGQLVDLEKTFEHELAHVAVDRARAGTPVPRWFHEGFALNAADEWSPERADIFGRAASAGALKKFKDIEKNFPEHSASAGLAYSQSLQFVMHVEKTAGKDVWAKLMSNIKGGATFDEAFRSAVGKSLAMSEAQWKQQAESSMSSWSILNDGTWGFFGATILFVVAWLVRRKRKRLKLASMSDDASNWDYDESRYPLPGTVNDV